MALKQILSRRPRIGALGALSTRNYVGLPDEVQMLKDMCRTFADQVRSAFTLSKTLSHLGIGPNRRQN